MKIKLIALFIMMGSLAAVADNDTYFFSKVDYGSVFVVQTASFILANSHPRNSQSLPPSHHPTPEKNPAN